MKPLRALTLSLFVVFCAGTAHADTILVPIDPGIKTGGVPDPLTPAGIITPNFVITSPTGISPITLPGGSACQLFQFGVLTSVSPHCYFQNDINPYGTGESITQLTFDIGGVSEPTVSCGFLSGSPFLDCSIAPLAGGGAQVVFTDGSIPFGGGFTLAFTGFPKNASFNTAAAITAEPGTMALLLSGFGALWVGRKLRFC
jgi:hypothetical protein